MAPRLGMGKFREVISFTRNSLVRGNEQGGIGGDEVPLHG
jgi:hypothetical protein